MFWSVLLSFLLSLRTVRVFVRAACAVLRYTGPSLPRYRGNRPARVLMAAAVSVAAVDWLSDNTIHPELPQAAVPPAVASLLDGGTIFGFAVLALVGVTVLTGTWLGDNVLLPGIALTVAALQIGLTAGLGWVVVAVAMTAVLCGVLWFLSRPVPLVVRVAVLAALITLAGNLLVPPFAG